MGLPQREKITPFIYFLKNEEISSVFIRFSGMAGNIFSFMLGSEHIPSLGASGAIFGLEGAVLSAFAYRRTLDTLTAMVNESKRDSTEEEYSDNKESMYKRERLSQSNSRELTRSLAYITIGLIIGQVLPFIDNYAHIGNSFDPSHLVLQSSFELVW